MLCRFMPTVQQRVCAASLLYKLCENAVSLPAPTLAPSLGYQTICTPSVENAANPSSITDSVPSPRFTSSRFKVAIALVEPQQPVNVGAVARTMAAFGHASLFISPAAGTPFILSNRLTLFLVR